MSRSSASSAAAIKDFLHFGSHLQLKRNLEGILSTLHGHPLQIQPHFTKTPLSSASLATSYIKNWIVRNQESVTGTTLRRILSITDHKHPIWKYKLDQSPRLRQYSEVLSTLQLEESKLLHLLKFKEDNLKLQDRLVQIQKNVSHVKMILKLMKPVVSGSLHPSADSAHASALHETISTGASSGSTAAEPFKIRGLLVRIAGPRKGNRAMTWEKSIGAVSTNSVDYVLAEDSQMQLPSKLGIFGLYLRIVYQKLSQRPLSASKNPADLKVFDGISVYEPFRI